MLSNGTVETKMKIRAFAEKLSLEEAQKKASRGNGFFGRLFLGKDVAVHMKTIYIENKIITYRVSSAPNWISRIVRRSESGRHSDFLIQMIANGSTCGVSYYDPQGVEITDMEVDEEQIQLSDFSDSALAVRGNALARRILKRRIGGHITLEVESIESVFRPYHVAFYGELREGAKVRYIPFPADGCTVKRTF